MVNQATARPASTAVCPSASVKCGFPVPEGGADAEVLAAADPLEALERVLGGPGYGGLALVPVAEGLAGGETGPLAAGVEVGAVAAGGFLGRQHPDGPGRIPALGLGGGDDVGQRPADVRELEALGELDGLGGRVAVGAGNGAKRGGPHRWSLSSYSERPGVLGVVAPRAGQAEVPGCREWFSLRRCGSAIPWADW